MLASLIAAILSFYLNKADMGDVPMYIVAAVLVLLPISLVCDYFYSKHELTKKTGASSVVMVVHVVIFALFGIGAIIVAVFSLVTMFTSAGDGKDTLISLYTGCIVALLYAAVLLRTLNPVAIPRIRSLFTVFMLAVTTLFIILSFLGPISQARITRNDKLIEANLSAINSQISSYTQKQKQLPTDLDQLTLSTDAKAVVSKRLVEYSALEGPTKTTFSNSYNERSNTFYYQLCATYTKSTSDKDGSISYEGSGDDEYQTYISSAGHESGRVCYKMKTTTY